MEENHGTGLAVQAYSVSMKPIAVVACLLLWSGTLSQTRRKQEANGGCFPQKMRKAFSKKQMHFATGMLEALRLVHLRSHPLYRSDIAVIVANEADAEAFYTARAVSGSDTCPTAQRSRTRQSRGPAPSDLKSCGRFRMIVRIGIRF